MCPNTLLGHYLKVHNYNLNINIKDDDNFVLSTILEKNFNNRKMYNVYLIIKYLYNDIDFNVNMNIYENKFFKFNKFNNIEKCMYIIVNVTFMLENLINEFFYNNSTKIYNLTPFVCINIQNVMFNEHLPEEFIKSFKKKNKIKKNLSDSDCMPDDWIMYQEIKENIEYNMKIALIFRLKNIEVVNNATKNQKSQNNKILFTNGNLLVLKPCLVDTLKNLLYLKKNVLTTPLLLTYKSNKNINDLLNNDNFSYPIWAEKFNNKINFLDPKLQPMLNKIYDLTEFVKIINNLNKTKIFLNYKYYINLKNSVLSNYNYNNILKNTQKKNNNYFLFSENYDSKISTEKIDKNKINKDLNKVLELELIFKQIDRLSAFGYTYYYNNYKLDRRTRLYVYNWPINYQTNHFVRSIISVNPKINVVDIYKVFFSKNYFQNIKNLNILWLFKQLNLNNLKQLLKKYKKNLDVDLLLSKNCDDLHYLDDFVSLESIIITLLNIAPTNIINFQEKLNYSVDITLKISNLNDLDISTLNDPLNKSLYENWKTQTQLKNALLGDCNDTYWADASSNAFQLIALTTGTQNELLLQLLNIIANKTDYKNIYDYVAFKLRNLNYDFCDVNVKNKINKWVTLQLIKTIIMPMSYGKTKWSCLKSTIKNLNELGCEIWNNLELSVKNKLISFWYDNALKILNDLDLNIAKHIILCKKYIKDSNIETKWLNIPIYTNTYKILNRTMQREKIKNNKNKIDNLINSIKKIDFYSKKTNLQIIDIAYKFTKTKNKFENLACEFCNIVKLHKTLKRSELKLKKDEENTRRINVSLKIKKRFQFRVFIKYNRVINIIKKNTAITPNATHSLDASLLFKFLQEINSLNIDVLVIHDSIGCNIKLLPIIIFLYKKTLLELIKNFEDGELHYPYNKFNHKYKKINDLELKIYKSNSLFF